MLRKVLGSSILYVPQCNRYQNINRFLCIRESLNEKVQLNQIQEYSSIAEKYQISIQELTEAIKVYSLSQYYDLSQNFPDQEYINKKNQKLFEIYQQTKYYGLGQSLQETSNLLKFKYPEIVRLSLPSSEKKDGLLELEQVFVNNGPKIKNFQTEYFIDQFIDQYKKKIQELNQKYQQLYGQEAAQVLQGQLQNILDDIDKNPFVQFGLLKGIIDIGLERNLNNTINQQTTLQKQIIEQNDLIDQFTKGFTEEERMYAKNVDEFELKEFLQENADNQYNSSKAQNKINEKGQKLIYETTTPDFHVLRYQILAAFFGLTFLYQFYQGDAQYKTIITVSALTYGFFTLSKYNLARRNIPYVKNILLNKDNTFEVLIERNRVLSRIESVAKQNLIIHYNSRNFFKIPFGSPNVNGYKCTINEQPALIPFDYHGNAQEFNQVLNNQA